MFTKKGLEFLEFLAGTRGLGHLQNVETHGLGQWPAFTNGHDITQSDVPVEANKCKKRTSIRRVVFETRFKNSSGKSAKEGRLNQMSTNFIII
jgi:hypothetical protein